MGLPRRKLNLPRFVTESREEKADNLNIGNWVFFTGISLSLVGFLFMVDTAFVFKGKFANGMAFEKILKETAIFIAGWIFALHISRLDIRGLKIFGAALMGVSLLMLFLVDFTPLGIEKNGCRRWLNLGICTVQPLEFFKLALVLQLAAFVSATGNISRQDVGVLLKPVLTIALGIFLLTMQPNISAVGIVGIVALLLAFISGLSGKHFLALLAILSVGVILLAVCLGRFGRFESYFNRVGSSSGPGYQAEMALKAIAHGGIFGVGLGRSIGKFAVPFNDSDFVYTIIVEETGIVGGTVVVLLFAGLIYFIWRLAMGQTDNYRLLLCLGIGVIIGVQAVMNIAVNLALIPPTGVPLPFISAGGSSLIVTLMAIGVILNIAGRTTAESNNVQAIR